MVEIDKQALDDHIMGVNDPNAPFNQEEYDFISDCCGSLPFGEIDDIAMKDEVLGICGDCKDHATFHLESGDDPSL